MTVEEMKHEGRPQLNGQFHTDKKPKQIMGRYKSNEHFPKKIDIHRQMKKLWEKKGGGPFDILVWTMEDENGGSPLITIEWNDFYYSNKTDV